MSISVLQSLCYVDVCYWFLWLCRKKFVRFHPAAKRQTQKMIAVTLLAFEHIEFAWNKNAFGFICWKLVGVVWYRAFCTYELNNTRGDRHYSHLEVTNWKVIKMKNEQQQNNNKIKHYWPKCPYHKTNKRNYK